MRSMTVRERREIAKTRGLNDNPLPMARLAMVELRIAERQVAGMDFDYNFLPADIPPITKKKRA